MNRIRATVADIARGELIYKYGNEYFVDPCDEPNYDAINELQRERDISAQYEMNNPGDFDPRFFDDEPCPYEKEWH